METTSTRTAHERVAGEVRATLARRRLSGRKVAQQLGWSPNYAHRRFSGETPLDVNDLVALAQLLDEPLSSFFPEMIFNGGGAAAGSNKQNYWTLRTTRDIYPTSAFAHGNRPDLAELAVVA